MPRRPAKRWPSSLRPVGSWSRLGGAMAQTVCLCGSFRHWAEMLALREALAERWPHMSGAGVFAFVTAHVSRALLFSKNDSRGREMAAYGAGVVAFLVTGKPRGVRRRPPPARRTDRQRDRARGEWLL